MKKEEAEEILRNLNVPLGTWSRAPEEELKIPRIQKQREMYEKLKAMLEAQVEKDVQKMSELDVALSRLKKARGLSHGRE